MVKMHTNLNNILQRIKIKCKVEDGLSSRGCDHEVKVGDFLKHRQSECAAKCSECDVMTSINKVADESFPRF